MQRFVLAVLFLMFIGTAVSAQGNMSLDDCIQTALKNNPDLISSYSQLGVAKANRLQAWSGILPNLSITAGPSRTFYAPSVSENNSTYTDSLGNVIQQTSLVTGPTNISVNHFVSVNWNQTFWDQGRTRNQIRQGNAGVRGMEYGVQNSVINTVLAVSERYYDLIKLIEQRQVLQESVEVAEEQLKNSQNMYEIGTVAQVDIYRSRVNVGNNQITLLNHELRIEDAKNNLNIAMGRDIGTPVDIRTDVSVDIDYDLSLDDLMIRGISSHPQLLQLEETAASSNFAIKAAKSNRWPTLSWNGQYLRFNSDINKVYKDANRDYQLSTNLRLNWNLFDGFQTKSNIQRAQNQTKIDDENLKRAKLTIQSNIRNFYLQLEQFRNKIDINRQIVDSAAEELRLENERYKVGSGTLIETIQAQSSYTGARYRLVEMQYDTKIAEARLNAAVGRLKDKYKDISPEDK